MTDGAIQPEGLPVPTSPYSPVVAAEGLVYTSGQVGTDAAGTVADGVEAQTRRALENVRLCLEAAGCSLADVVKVNLPEFSEDKAQQTPAPYNKERWDEEEAVQRAVEAAGKVPVLVSGGSRVEEEDVLHKARLSVRAGATGIIFGRNVWQRPHDDALALTKKIRQIMLEEAGVLTPALAR